MNKAKEKLDLLFDSFDEFTQKKYNRFFETFKQYTYGKLNTSMAKNKMKDVSRFISAFTYLIKNIDKDLDDMTEKELYDLVLNEKVNTTQRRVLSRYYGFLKINNLYPFQDKLSICGEVSLKNDSAFYSAQEWSQYINVALDIDTLLPRALNNVNTARSWLYLLLHLCVAWRKNDIINMPALSNLIDIEKYNLEWFENNTFTLADAGYVINNTKLCVEQYLTIKTNVKKNFNIPISFYIPLAISLIAVENWRRVLEKETLFGNFTALKQTLSNNLGEIMNKFTSLKANRTLLSFVDIKASEIGMNDVVRISSYMRAHTVNEYGFNNNTSVYLKSTYSEKELQEITLQLYNRGPFGWMYDTFLNLASDKREGFNQNTTNEIINIKEKLPVKQLNEVASILYSQKLSKENVINELLHLPKEDIKKIFSELVCGLRTSRQENVYCLKPTKCKDRLVTDCYNCKYSIPTVHILFSIKDELDKVFSEIKPCVYQYDKLRKLDKMLKLFSIVKEAIETFGEEYVNTIIPIEDTKKKLTENYRLLTKEEL